MTITDTLKHAVASQGASRQAMSDAKLPLAYRDTQCSQLLINLNKCRTKEYYLPWKCEDERHGYEKCLYEDFKVRMDKQAQLKAERADRPVEEVKSKSQLAISTPQAP